VARILLVIAASLALIASPAAQDRPRPGAFNGIGTGGAATGPIGSGGSYTGASTPQRHCWGQDKQGRRVRVPC
jgi:hypothetical protein